MSPTLSTTAKRRLAAVALVPAFALGLAACGGPSTPTAGNDNAPTTIAKSAGGGQVLPVSQNPITNASTAKTLTIESVLVENNVDKDGKAVDDHLEVALANSGASDLAGVEVFYTFTDPKAGAKESYYAKLPGSFTIPAGGSRVAHFDNTGAPDHFPANEFSLYKTSVNELDVEVIVSADGAAVQTATAKKDAGGAETPD